MTRRSFFATLAALLCAPRLSSRPDYSAWVKAGQVRGVSGVAVPYSLIDETHWHPLSNKLSGWLHGTEAIITPDQAAAFARDAGIFLIDLRMKP